MPISKENRKLYPKDWKEISHYVRFVRALERCECKGECGLNHNDNAEIAGDIGLGDKGRCEALHYQPHPRTGSKVVLTVAHLDHDPTNNNLTNLKAMCQQCHNRYDQPHRQANAKKTRQEKKLQSELDAGQLPLI